MGDKTMLWAVLASVFLAGTARAQTAQTSDSDQAPADTAQQVEAEGTDSLDTAEMAADAAAADTDAAPADGESGAVSETAGDDTAAPDTGGDTEPVAETAASVDSAQNAPVAETGAASEPTSADGASTPAAREGADQVTDVEVAVEPATVGQPVSMAFDRVVNLPTAATVPRGTLQLVVDHRAYESFLSGEDAFFDYLGLDAGNLKIGIGLRVGIADVLDAGLYRLSSGKDPFDVYEFDVKAALLDQRAVQVNAALRAGVTWFVQPDRRDASGVWGQVVVDRWFADLLLVGAGFGFHTNSTSESKVMSDKEPSAAVFGYLEVRPVSLVALGGEVAYAVAGYRAKAPVFSFFARVHTQRHAFALVVSNSQYTSADGVVANAPRTFDDLVFGFQIARQFPLW